jgi:hypothetical protein
MLPSGFGRATHIAPTPEGLVWGTRHGVWLWQGGDTATNMAPQLAYDFWWDDATMGRWAYQQPKGRPVCHYPYLFFPNGWICDMRFKSWFRIGDQHPPSGTRPVHWTLASNGDVLGVQAGHLLNGPFTDKVAMTRFDPTQYGINWFWSSQPLAKTRNRILNFREVAFTVHNPTTAQTVQFSAYGTQADGTLGTYNHNFSVPVSPRPQTIRFGMSLDVGDVQFSINNFSTNGTGPALSLHRISLGFVDQQSVKAI